MPAMLFVCCFTGMEERIPVKSQETQVLVLAAILTVRLRHRDPLLILTIIMFKMGGWSWELW